MQHSCEKCTFCELVVNKGDSFTIFNPIGEEVHKVHQSNVLICRYHPPISGDWPQVSEDDWCGKFKSNKD